jgi:GTP-binding protein Era
MTGDLEAELPATHDEGDEPETDFRSGFVAVVGRPNAGKSTLINHVVGEHVAIVSPVAQTTRRVVRAVLHRDDAQLVFVDLPGSQKPVDRLTTRMQAAVVHSLADVDVVLWVVDCSVEAKEGERAVAKLVTGAGLPVIVAANKVDRVAKPKLLERIAAIADMLGDTPYEAIVPISATTGDGCDLLVETLVAATPHGTPWFGDDDVTDMRVSERVSEHVREAALGFLRDELPHATVVEVDEIIDEGKRIVITATIWVERASQVGIVVGKGGATIKDIGMAARKTLQSMLGRRVHLDVRVKVREGWRDDDAQLERWGL